MRAYKFPLLTLAVWLAAVSLLALSAWLSGPSMAEAAQSSNPQRFRQQTALFLPPTAEQEERQSTTLTYHTPIRNTTGQTETVLAPSAGGMTATATMTTTWPCWVRLNDTPYDTIQEAVDASTHVTDVVKIAGYCRGVEVRGGLTQTVYLSKTLTLQGGYTVTNWTTPDPVANPTTLDAAGEGRVIYIMGDTLISPTIAGLRLINGDATGMGGFQDGSTSWDVGGNLYAYNASPTVQDCEIVSGVVPLTGQGGGLSFQYGGMPIVERTHIEGNVGALMVKEAHLTLRDSTIISNTRARWSGVIFIEGDYRLVSFLEGNLFQGNDGYMTFKGGAWTIRDNHFIGNMNRYAVGPRKIVEVRPAYALIEDNLFQDNMALAFDFLFNADFQNPSFIRHNRFIGNGTSLSGDSRGALGVWADGFAPVTLLTIEDNLFQNNHGDYGGAISFSRVERVLLRDNRFISNTADYGGAIYVGDSQIDIINNAFLDNEGTTSGGGLYATADDYGPPIDNGSVYIAHNTFADNSGAGIALSTSTQRWNKLTITNTIIASNTVGVDVSDGMTVTLNGVLWYNNGANTSGTGVTQTLHERTGDPAFAADGYHLTAHSAALDEGVACAVDDDIDGQSRPMLLAPDLGADEYVPQVDLTLHKARPVSDPVFGSDVVTFTLTISADETSEIAPDVLVTDTVEPASAVAAMAGQVPGGTCGADGSVLTCTVYSVPTDTVRVVTVWVTTALQFDGLFTNTAIVTPTNAAETDAGDNEDSVIVSVQEGHSDLWVTKSAPEYASSGDTLQYIVNWGNGGQIEATAVVLTDTLPEDVTFISATPSPDSSAGPLVWDLGSVSPDTSGAITITVSVNSGLPDGTELVNRAAISGTEEERETANNEATATTTVHDLAGYNLYITKKSTEWPLDLGEDFFYTIIITNTGEHGAQVTMEDPIPDDLEFVNNPPPTANRGTVSYSGGKVVWTGYLDVGEGVEIEFTVRAVSCEHSCGVIRNVATINIEGLNYPWHAINETHVRCPDLTVSLDGPRYLEFNEEDNYTIQLSYRNANGAPYPGDALSTTLTLALDQYTTFQGASVFPTDVYSDGLLVWDLETLNAGDGETIQVTVRSVYNIFTKPPKYTFHADLLSDYEYHSECQNNLPNSDDMGIWLYRMDWEKRASAMTYNAQSKQLEQRYYLYLHKYETTDPNLPMLEDYAIVDQWPSELGLQQYSHYPAMDVVQEPFEGDPVLELRGRGPLPNGHSIFVELLGVADGMSLTPGATIINRADITGTISGEEHSKSATVETTVPVVPPLITYPGNGEVCTGTLTVKGVAQPNTNILILNANTRQQIGTGTTDDQGHFAIPITIESSVSIIAESYDDQGNTADSRPVALSVVNSYWCPQRSYWEATIQAGPMKGTHVQYGFVDDNGNATTNGWTIPGLYGFWDTDLYVYLCDTCESNNISITVTADGVDYTPVSVANSVAYFRIGKAHNVQIHACCGDECQEDDGEVLIDPDGFVFNVDKGGSYDTTTGMFTPVEAVPGVTVTCYVSMPEWGGWVIWPAEAYSQTNPQVTDDSYTDGITTTGYFAFFTPPGQYYLEVEGIPGYQQWRSPVVEVITQIVHVNVPYTPRDERVSAYVGLTTNGPDPEIVTVAAGSTVEWYVDLGEGTTITDVVRWSEDPIFRPLSMLDPLENTDAFDGGYLTPNTRYRRTFHSIGTFTYTDGLGHTGVVVVTTNRLFLPIVMRDF